MRDVLVVGPEGLTNDVAQDTQAEQEGDPALESPGWSNVPCEWGRESSASTASVPEEWKRQQQANRFEKTLRDVVTQIHQFGPAGFDEEIDDEEAGKHEDQEGTFPE